MSTEHHRALDRARHRRMRKRRGLLGRAGKIAFDENLLRSGRDIPNCPFGVFAFPIQSHKHNGLPSYGYHL